MQLINYFSTPQELAIVKIACENDFRTYIKLKHKFQDGVDFTFLPFHHEIIDALEKIANYETTCNLLINMPVGFGKSVLISDFTEWCFIRNKNITFLYTSYSDALIQKHSTSIKDSLKGEFCSILWGYEFQKDKNSKANWSIEGGINRSGLTAGAMGGTITGLDAGNPAVNGFCGAMIIDDPQKATDIIFENYREDTIHKYTAGLKTRLRRADVPTILIMQRLHEEDLTGYILQKESDDWDVITVKAMVDDKSIWEDKVSTATLQKERENTPWVFYAQRQQEPNTNINSSFKGLQFTDNDELIHNGIGHIDKGFDGEDGTAFTIIKKQQNGDYIAFGKHWNKHIDDCLHEIKTLAELHRCGTIHTEMNDDKGYLAKNNSNISAYQERQNKHFKIMSYLYPVWKSIYFLKSTDDFYIRQIQNYNEKAKHDDCPDSAASLIRVYEKQTVWTGQRPI